MRSNLHKTVATLAVIQLTAVMTVAQNTTDQQQSQPGAIQQQGAQQQQSSGRQSQRPDGGVQLIEEYEAVIVSEPAGAQPEKTKEKHFIKQAAVENKLEIALSQLAEEKAEHQQVKQFAQKLGEAHEQTGRDIQQMAQQNGVPIDLQQFQQMVRATGQQFDQHYLSYITKEGREGLQYMEQIANQHPDPRIKQFARQHLPDMRQYLQQAQRAQTEIQASGPIQEPAGAQQGQQGAPIREQAGAPSGQQGMEMQLQQLQQQVQQLQEQVQQLQNTQQGGQQMGQQQMPDGREFVKMASAYCKMGTVLNQLAAQKANSQQVRQLVQQQKQSMQQNNQQLRDLAQQYGVQVDTQQLQQLGDARGRQFDQGYIRFVTEHHRQAVQDLERLSNESQNQQIQQFARQQLPELRQHLEEAQRLQTQLQAGGGAIQEPAGAETEDNQLPKN